ncbi:MAG: hypothetical protein IJ466_07405 [Clostridia bacterium]|nr:hypothetical protein [Clostridia bacterium]
MAKRYEIWDKVSPVITPIGEYFTPEQWIAKYPAAAHITYVCQAGKIKGGFFDSLHQLKTVRGMEGCDFSACTTDEEILEAIEAFEDARNAEAANYVSTEERIAAALEAQTMMQMADVEETA